MSTSCPKINFTKGVDIYKSLGYSYKCKANKTKEKQMTTLTRKELQTELRIMREKGLTDIRLNAKNTDLQAEYDRLNKKSNSTTSKDCESIATKVEKLIKTFKLEYETSMTRGHGVWKQGKRYSFLLNNETYHLELFNKVKLEHPLVKNFIRCILELNIKPNNGVFYIEYDEGKGWTLDFEQNYRILLIDRIHRELLNGIEHTSSIFSSYFVVFSDYYNSRRIMSNPESYLAINDPLTFDNLKHVDLINKKVQKKLTNKNYKGIVTSKFDRCYDYVVHKTFKNKLEVAISKTTNKSDNDVLKKDFRKYYR